MEKNKITIYVNVPDEGSPTMRPTQAIDMGNGFFKLLPAENYDPSDEAWEFPPGSIVKAEKRYAKWGEYFYAIKSW